MSQLDEYLKEEHSVWKVQQADKYVRNVSVRKGAQERWQSHPRHSVWQVALHLTFYLSELLISLTSRMVDMKLCDFWG